MFINSFNIHHASPLTDSNSFISLYDTHNHIDFIVDTASPVSLLPLAQFPSFFNPNKSCMLFTANGRPLQQAGSVDLTIHFDNFPNSSFTHTFVLANVNNAILGLDFLSQNHFMVNTTSKSVFISDSAPHNATLPPLQIIDYSSYSYSDIIQLFPNLTAQTVDSTKKKHPFEHTMTVTGSPVSFRPRRFNATKMDALNLLLDDLLQKKIIRPSISPWASPVHLVKKKNGSYRLVHDYRIVNSRCQKQNYPLPRLTDFTQYIDGANVFSKLDLRHAFWQLDVRPCDRQYTAFSTHRGNFEYNKMPQGLTYASSSFQRFINHVMNGTEAYCFCYIDDIIIFSKTVEDHKKHLYELCNRLNTYGLMLNLEKCSLGVDKLLVFGYQLSSQGLAVAPDKIVAFQQLPEPTTIKELRQALGLINYQRRFIKNAAQILAPLNMYLRGKVTNSMKITLNNEAKEAFSAIKRAICNAAYLAHPQKQAHLCLKTDASKLALGSILEQHDGENIEVIGYYSKTLTATQSRYSTYDLELLAVYSSVKYFEHLLLDTPFTIFTDNKSLVNSFSKPSENHTPKQVRQLSYLSQFDCTIEHLPGKDNIVADCLSRLVVHHIFDDSHLPVTLNDIAIAQTHYTNTDAFTFPSNTTILLQKVTTPNSTLPLLIDTSTNPPRILLPPSLEHKIMQHYHTLGHLGIKATQRLIQSRFVFKQMNAKVRDFVRSCTNCQRTKIDRHINSPISSVPMPNQRFERVNVDIAGPFPHSLGNSYVLVCIDPYTRWIEAFSMRDQTTSSVIHSFNYHVQNFGAPVEIHTDAGCQFTSHNFKQYCQYLGANHRIISVLYPASNGLAERAIKSLKTALTAKLDSPNWALHLSSIVLSLNTMLKEAET